MSLLGIGIIGCGNISTTYFSLSPLFKGVEIRACADINMDAAKAKAEEYGVRAETIDGLLASKDIDIIVNLTIPDAHYAVTKQILEAGKHAYSEKPVVLSLEEGKTLRDLAASKGLKVGSAPDTFLGGSHQQARAHLDSGAVGEITSGTAIVLSHGMEHWHPNPDFFFQPGGGPVLDLGPYYIANLINLIGPVKRVAALTSMAQKTRTISSQPRAGETVPVDTPTNVHAILEFEQGATITMLSSWDVWAHKHSNMELYGTRGSLYVPDPNFFGGAVHAGGGDFTAVAPLEPWDHPLGVNNQDDKGQGRANYRAAGLADMAIAIMEDRDHRCSLERALHAVDVMTSILKSGETGEFVAMTTSCTRPAALGIEEAHALLK